jgi:hypothetical protein
MAAGSIIVDLLLKTGTFENDTKRAGKALKDFKKEATDTARAIKASFVGNLLADFAQQFGSAIAKLPAQIVNGLDALNDLADATGASVESLSALESVANKNGQTLEDVGGVLIKFNKALADADGKNGVSEALRRIGLDAKELQRLDPAEAIRETAIALQGFATDGDKARLVQELFGKSIKDAGPFLKDLAAAGQLNAKVTTEQAQAAEDFNKAIFALQTSTKEAARALVSDLLPSVNEIIKAFIKARETGESMMDAIFGNTAQQRASGNAATLSQDLARTTDAIARMQEEFNRGGGSDSRLELRLKKAKDRAFELQKQITATTGALKGIADDREPIVDPTNYSLERDRRGRSVGPAPLKPEKAKKAKETKDLDEQVKAYRKHLEELSEAEQSAAKSAEDQYRAQVNVLDGYKEEAAVARELAKTYGFTREELEALDREKLLAQAAALELLAIQKEEKEGGEVLGRLYREQAKAIREAAAAREELSRKQTLLERDPLTGATQAVKDYLDEVQRAGDGTRRVVEGAIYGLEDVLSSKNPKEAAKRLVDGLIQEFYRLLVIKPLMKSLLGEGGGIGDAIKGIFGLLGAGSSGSAIPSSSVSAFPQFATGTESVPKTGLALVHQGEKIIPASRAREGTKVVVNNVPAGYTFDASEDGDGTTVLDMRSVARAEIARASRPGGTLRRSLKRGPPDRA